LAGVTGTREASEQARRPAYDAAAKAVVVQELGAGQSIEARYALYASCD